MLHSPPFPARRQFQPALFRTTEWTRHSCLASGTRVLSGRSPVSGLGILAWRSDRTQCDASKTTRLIQAFAGRRLFRATPSLIPTTPRHLPDSVAENRDSDPHPA